MKRNWVGHNQQGSSDKVYIVSVQDRSDGTYAVVGKWGRRNRIVSEQTKLTTKNESAAYAEMNREIDHRKKRGYVDIESSSYHGPTRMSDSDIQDHLEPEDAVSVSSKPVRTSKVKKVKTGPVVLPDGDFIVKCVDNSGMSDLFDAGIEYVAEHHDDSEMIWVYDKLGNKGEHFRERFKYIPGA